MYASGLDPYGTNLALRTTTDGRVTSSAWTVSAGIGTPTYEILNPSSSPYFQASWVNPSSSSPGGVSNRYLQLTHDFVPITEKTYYTFVAYIYGATATMSSSSVPQIFRAYVDFDEYSTSFGGITIRSMSGIPDTTTLAYQVASITPQYVSRTRLLGSLTKYIKPFVRLEFSDTTIPANTTVEFRFGSCGLYGGRAAANFNGTTVLSDGYATKAYGTTDPLYGSSGPDVYSLMTTTEPSIGTRIERECFVEQIRHTVRPSNAQWVMELGLSDAITGSFWVLDQSRLDVDTRLSI